MTFSKYLQRLSPGEKLWGLAVFILLLTGLAWQFSFSKTLALRRELQRLNLLLADSRQAASNIEQVQADLRQLEQKHPSASYTREQIFEHINSFCHANHITLLRYHPEVTEEKGTQLLVTHRIDIRCAFKDAVRLLWYVEREKRLGRVASVAYRKMEDKRSGDTWLATTFYLQYFQKNTEE